MQADPAIHWTTYVQTFAAVAATIGTFVYVWFTYHIMKWAVGQGKAGLAIARNTLEQQRAKKFVLLRDLEAWVKELPRPAANEAISWQEAQGVLTAWGTIIGRINECLTNGDLPITFGVALEDIQSRYTRAGELWQVAHRSARVSTNVGKDVADALVKLVAHWPSLSTACYEGIVGLLEESIADERLLAPRRGQ